jgi:lyso-ornithine lipid O-acyltransferase
VAVSVLESFLLLGSATSIIPKRKLRLSARLTLNHRLAKLLARAIGLKIDSSFQDYEQKDRETRPGRLILANHTSVLDAVAIAALTEVVFITSRDIAESLPVRWLATIGGAAFVERRNRDSREEELETLENLLLEGRTIVLFPEATSTDGSEILRFRNGLLHAALRVPGTEILPLCLQYQSIGGKPVDRANRERVFLYGEMSVFRHLLRIFSNPEVRLEIQAFTPFKAADFEYVGKIAAHAEFLIRSVYRGIK